jgi:hypothetical protein
MRLTRVVAALLGLLAPFAVVITADASSIGVSRSAVTAGGTVIVSGDVRGSDGLPVCSVPATVTLSSVAFANQSASATAASDGTFSTRVTISREQAGTFAVSGSCGGVDLGTQALVTITPGLPIMGRPPDDPAPAGAGNPWVAGTLLLLGLGLGVGAAGSIVWRRGT